eukprot:CAMPEP_0194523684 /NCGR_PEP_ID=MMETSP0253-20130528/58638_1 /TAXON_ID=2966 /ORGANISM="Noctiluca scintillans" /LENGTH=390 /DNA_ID=CAMNT_0039368247 /DNA_START=1 /DNA_END=1170 /DNA_ORIENTATION=+
MAKDFRRWTVLPGVDAFPGLNALGSTMPASDMLECKRVCVSSGCGGFVTSRGVCYFRKAPAEELLRLATPKKGCCTYICAAPSRSQDLYNSDVRPSDWRARCVLEEAGGCITWQSLRAQLEMPQRLSARVSQLELLRRLRLDPCRPLDYTEIAGCLGGFFVELDIAVREIARRREDLEGLEDEVGDIPVKEAHRVMEPTLIAVDELQRVALNWKAEAQLKLADDDVVTKDGLPRLPSISFSALAAFLETALASEDNLLRKIKVLDAVRQCAMEEARKKMDIHACAYPVTVSAGAESPVVSVSERELTGSVGVLVAALMGPGEARVRLRALTQLQKMLEWEPRAPRALRAVRGAQRALCGLQSARQTSVDDVAAADIGMLATEVERKCFVG